MNLLFLDSVDKETFGGYENWILLTAKHFAAEGHKVIAVGRRDSEYLRRAKEYDPRIETHAIDISGDFHPVTIYQMKKLLKENHIDLMTVNFNKDVRIGGLAARWHGDTKVIWRIGLDITSNGWAHHFLSPKLVDGVIVPSKSLKHQVMRHGYLREEMVRVIHNGTVDKHFDRPDPEAAQAIREKYNLPENCTIAVTVGRFVDQKGHIYLVDAAPQIVEKNPEIVFLFLGNGPHEAMLRSKIDAYNLQKHFVFAGMLDNIETELAGSDLMVHPAVEEPFSHAILEAMRAGLPIVASKVGGIPEAVEEGRTAVLVEPRNPDELAHAVNELLSSSDKMLKFGLSNQQRWRENFRLETMMQEVEVYFKEILSK